MFFCFVLFCFGVGWLCLFYVFFFLLVFSSSCSSPPCSSYSSSFLSLLFLSSSSLQLVCLSSMANLGWMFLQDGLVLISSRVSRSPTRVVESHVDYLNLSHCGALASELGMCWRLADGMVGFLVARISLRRFTVWRMFLDARCC